MRTFQQIQDFAAEIFNRDNAIKKTYTGESWTKAAFKMNIYFHFSNFFPIFLFGNYGIFKAIYRNLWSTDVTVTNF